MPTLNSLIDEKFKSPSYEVRLNGKQTKNVLQIDVQSSLDDRLSEATIRLMNDPNIAPEAQISIRQGYEGQNAQTFVGYVDSVEYDEFEKVYIVAGRDVLKKAMDTFLVQEVAFGIDRDTGTYKYSTLVGSNIQTALFHIHEYSSLAALHANHPETAFTDDEGAQNISEQGALAEFVVQQMLVMTGLQAGSQISLDHTHFYIGDITAAKFHLESVYDACMQIAQLIGWRLYADGSGKVRFRRRPRNPGGYSYWTYTDLRQPYNIHSINKTVSNTDLRTYVEVRGASGIVHTTRGTSPYIGNTPYRGVLISSELIDTPGIASFMAERVYNDLNRLKITAVLDVDGNPTLVPGSTLRLSSRVLTGNYLLKDYQSTMSAENGYKMSLAAEAYPGDPNFTEPASGVIVADFIPIQIAAFGDPTWVVTFDGSASYSDHGSIVTWNWEWPDSSTTTAGNPTSQFAFDYDSIANGNSQAVTLTVTDSTGSTGFVTKEITASGLNAIVQTQYRSLYAALENKAVGTSNGGLSWNTINFPAISVGASNFMNGGQYVTSGFALFGTNDSKIHKTVDVCVTSRNVYTTLGTDVTDVFVAELDGNFCLAGDNLGNVYSSRNAGESWTLVGNLGTPIRQVRHAYTDYNYILALASGTGNIWESFNLGGNWSKISQLSDIDPRWNDAGTATNYYAHTAGVKSLAGGAAGTVTFPAGSPDVPALTVTIDRDDGVMIVDSTGQHWVATSGAFVATQYNPVAPTRHMIRDGELQNVVYYANASGVGKSLNQNQTMQELYYPGGGVNGRMVAYGPLTKPVIQGNFVLKSPHSLNNGIMIGGTTPSGVPEGIFVNVGSGWYRCLDYHANVVTTPGYFVAYSDTAGGNLDPDRAFVSTLRFSVSGVLPQIFDKSMRWYEDTFIDRIMISRKTLPPEERLVLLCCRGTRINNLAQPFNAFIVANLGNFLADPDVGYVALNTYPEEWLQVYHLRNVTDVEPYTDRFITSDRPNLFSDPGWTVWNYEDQDNPLQSHYARPAGEYSSDVNFFYKLQGHGAGVLKYRNDNTITVPNSSYYGHTVGAGTGSFGDNPQVYALNTVYNDAFGNTGASAHDGFDPEINYPTSWTGFGDSAIIKSDLYLATSGFVYRSANYGEADPEILWDSSPYGAAIWTMTVTHDVAETKDFICVLLKNGRLFFSIDGGEAWAEGPMADINGTSNVAAVWWVDTPTEVTTFPTTGP